MDDNNYEVVRRYNRVENKVDVRHCNIGYVRGDVTVIAGIIVVVNVRNPLIWSTKIRLKTLVPCGEV